MDNFFQRVFSPTIIRYYDVLSIILISFIVNNISKINIDGTFNKDITIILYLVILTLAIILIHRSLVTYKQISSFQVDDKFVNKNIKELNSNNNENDILKHLTFQSLYNQQLTINNKNGMLSIYFWWSIISIISLLILAFV